MRYVVPLWLAFVTTISMMPLKFKYRLGTTGSLHAPGHFLVFLITSILVCRTRQTPASRLLRLIGVCFFAFVLEILEWATYHHRMEWGDVLVDFCGAFLGLAVLSILPAPSTHVQDSGT